MPQGLSTVQAELKLKEFGYNAIVEKKKANPLLIFINQFRGNLVISVLLGASIVSFFLEKRETSLIIMVVILLTALTGFFLEYKAEKSIEALKSLVVPQVLVERDGKLIKLNTKFLVPDDIVHISSGEKIPADCVLLEAKNLRVNESIITGESVDVSKTIWESGDTQKEQIILMGTFVVNGRGVAKVLHTGMNTQFGKIAQMISDAEKELPLQKKINEISKFMMLTATIISLITGTAMFVNSPEHGRDALISAAILAIALAISAFPEGFAVVLTSTLALGASRMAQKFAIVNRLSTIETLGEVTVICTDKTGTVTTGEMTSKFIFTGDNLYEVEGVGYEAVGRFMRLNSEADILRDPTAKLILEAVTYCNDASIESSLTGSNTEISLLVLSAKAKIYKDSLDGKRVEEIPFNSDRKLMSVLIETNDGLHVFTKGAPEKLVPLCLNDTKKFTDFANEMSKKAYRVIGVAHKKLESRNFCPEDLECNLNFIGLVAMADPPRDEAKAAVARAKGAGIEVKLISGDNLETVKSIAEQIGITGKSITGTELDYLSDSELKVAVTELSIFARVLPGHKLRIVKALKANGHVVAMTGDGVNDSPAIKEAHVGVAMGKNGTDVSRSVADLVLKDDNFATIVEAVSEGRTVFGNIRKFITYQLACNYAELFTLMTGVVFAPVLGWKIPALTAMQILFMNIVTDNLPAITLGFNPASKYVMTDKPRKNGKILNSTTIKLIIFHGALMGLFTLIPYYIAHNILGYSNDYAQTTALLSLILVEIAGAFGFRSFKKFILNRSLFVNRSLFAASVVSILMTVVVIYTPARVAFDTTPVGYVSWIIALTATLLYVIVFDVAKILSLRSSVYHEDTK